MPAKWNRPVFWFRFYEGEISCVSFILAVRDAPSLPCHILLRAAAIYDRPICVIIGLRHCARAARRPKMCSRSPQRIDRDRGRSPLHNHVVRIEVQSDQLVIELVNPKGADPKRKPSRNVIEVPWHKTPSTRRREVLIPEAGPPTDTPPHRSENRAIRIDCTGRRWLDEPPAGAAFLQPSLLSCCSEPGFLLSPGVGGPAGIVTPRSLVVSGAHFGVRGVIGREPVAAACGCSDSAWAAPPESGSG
jgi:hypothetical protein